MCKMQIPLVLVALIVCVSGNDRESRIRGIMNRTNSIFIRLPTDGNSNRSPGNILPGVSSVAIDPKPVNNTSYYPERPNNREKDLGKNDGPSRNKNDGPSHNENDGHTHNEDDDHFHTNLNNSSHDFRNLHTDPKILIAPESGVSLNPEMNDICSICPCTTDSSQIVCEYEPSIRTQKDTLVLSAELIPRAAKSIQITGYKKLEIKPKTFANEESKLRLIAIENIQQIDIATNSFLFGAKAKQNVELILQIVKSKIPKLPTMSITQNTGGTHGKQAFKAEKTRFLSVEIHTCEIEKIDSRAIYRASLIFFNISNTTIKTISKKAIDLDVYEMVKIKGNKLPAFPVEALCFHAKKVVFSGNIMKEINNHSIVIEADSQVLFDNNEVLNLRMNGLAGIVPKPGVYGASIVFLKNLVHTTEPGSLYIDDAFPAHERKVLNNSFNIECTCNISVRFERLMGLKQGQNYDKASYENAIENSLCKEPETRKFMYVDVFMAEECAPIPVVTISAVTASIILFIVAVTVCVVCSLRVQQVKEEANMLGECTSQSFSTISRHYYEHGEPYYKYPGDRPQSPSLAIYPWVAAVPEVKTYQQSQLPDLTEQTESICGASIRGSMHQTELENRILTRASCPFN